MFSILHLEDRCSSRASGGHAGNNESAGENLTAFLTAYPDLAAVVDAWPSLSQDMRAAISSLSAHFIRIMLGKP